MLKDSRDNESISSMKSQELNAKGKAESTFDSIMKSYQKSPESFNKGRVLTRSMKKV